mmetsp:Transcript_14146/g.47756  ORF Transcript_14146/g.47756 Transcript_14146/m.47756 type:complete len:444 (-) Transcript_14146:433-1764(-)
MVVNLVDAPLHGAGFAVAVVLVLEVVFFIAVRILLLPLLQRRSPVPPQDEDAVEVIKRITAMVDRLDSVSPEGFIEGWFLGTVKAADVKRGDVHSFLSWAMYSCDSASVRADAEREARVGVGVAELERQLGRRLAPGTTPGARHCRMTMEPVPMVHRPLLMYVALSVVDMCCWWVFYQRGFRRINRHGLGVWYRNGSGSSPDALPVVVLHGISSGWAAYSRLVGRLCEDPCRPVLLVDYPAVKMKLRFDPMPRDRFVHAVGSIMEELGLRQAAFLGHSFGSVLVAWMARRRPELVAHVTLLDPVCLLLSLPDVSFNFLYRRPSTITEHFIHLFAAREIGVSYVLRRAFWWKRNELWLEQLRCPCVVFLGGQDEVVPARQVAEYVTRHKGEHEAALVYYEGFHHAQVLLSAEAQDRVLFAMDSHEKRIAARVGGRGFVALPKED